MNRTAAKAYGQAKSTAAADASNYRLVQLLMQNVLDKITLAKGAMQHNQIEAKCLNISMAISIIEGLQQSLDMEKGGELAENLLGLYGYMILQLLKANIENEPTFLQEVFQLMLTIKEGWDGIENNEA